MLQDIHDWITIHDVARGMRVRLDDDAACSIGARAATAWEWQSGTAPVKDLRHKKNGGGKHCFALYPPSFAERIQLIIRGYRPPGADQMDLDL